jgi:hypothetical protein
MSYIEILSIYEKLYLNLSNNKYIDYYTLNFKYFSIDFFKELDEFELQDVINISLFEKININNKINVTLHSKQLQNAIIEFISTLSILTNISNSDILIMDDYENIILKRKNNKILTDITSQFPFELLNQNYDRGMYLTYSINFNLTKNEISNIKQNILNIVSLDFSIQNINFNVQCEKYFCTQLFTFFISNKKLVIEYFYNFENNQIKIIQSMIFNIIKTIENKCQLVCSYDIIHHKDININLNYDKNRLISIDWNNFECIVTSSPT